jgi:hypothetical protein
MPTTPPRESIGGNKGNHLSSFEFSRATYAYIVDMERFKESNDYNDLTEDEKMDFKDELTHVNAYYENLINRVKNY